MNSSNRKLALSGWLYENSVAEFENSLKLQKFLFFYEALSKVENDSTEFAGLKGYANGPVFSAVWGDYRYEQAAFQEAAVNEYHKHATEINNQRAKLSMFLVQIFNEKNLSAITHTMDVWKHKEPRITAKEKNVSLSERDFSKADSKMMKEIALVFSEEFIDNSNVITVGKTNFIFSNDDARALTPMHYDVLMELDSLGELENPVYANIDSDGAIIID
jgi:hypothetical protein